ncbi:type II toxin-antitoxin system RelE/ParE family toxin [Candidatus Woesearchaeota archaeon]|nr:type II toxin-antitoxin system RelE/ParE family toxin [Candidatus Woesearchaeota archaeon]
MSFEIIVHPKAAKILEKLPKIISDRIIRKLEEVKEDPRRYAEKLVESDDYKIRAGDYRIFVGVTHNPDTLEVYSIKHRKEAYKRH